MAVRSLESDKLCDCKYGPQRYLLHGWSYTHVEWDIIRHSLVLLFPWLFPSSRVAGMTWLMIFVLHVALSISSSALTPNTFKSRWHSSLNTFLSMCSLSRFITCSQLVPVQSSLGDLFGRRTLNVPHTRSILVLSLRVTLHFHHLTLIS